MTVPGEGSHEEIKGLPFELPPVSPSGVASMIERIAREQNFVERYPERAELHEHAAGLLQRHLLFLFPELDANPVLDEIRRVRSVMVEADNPEGQGE